MKRTFLSRRNALFTYSSFSWGGAALGFAVLVLAIRLLLPDLFLQAMTPAFSASAGLASASRGFFASFEDAAALAAKNEELQNENAALANENKALMDKADAIASLSPTAGGIPGGVVSRPPSSPYDTFIVAAGAKAGVVPGMEAFGPGDVPIGIASDVLPDFTRITLFSSPTMTFNAWAGKAHTPILITGAGGGAFHAVLPRLAGVAVGDDVSVAAGGALPIGSIVRIDSDPSSPTVTLHIQSAVNLFSITWVEFRPTGPSFVDALSWKDAGTP